MYWSWTSKLSLVGLSLSPPVLDHHVDPTLKNKSKSSKKLSFHLYVKREEAMAPYLAYAVNRRSQICNEPGQLVIWNRVIETCSHIASTIAFQVVVPILKQCFRLEDLIQVNPRVSIMSSRLCSPKHTPHTHLYSDFPFKTLDSHPTQLQNLLSL
ncbi:unnamed protein product [Vicia faba]|uniref:Uncharacterized protein n=1 Tax=Vicia faba TaxID=3906 RepID=A0AAV1B5V0_VICFA|nr:unnamed protein product [Vicia faba]